MTENTHTAGHAALKQAETAARRGDIAGAERWSKTAERLALAAARLDEAPEPVAPNEEELRAELRARIQRFVDDETDMQAWYDESRAHEAAVREAQRTGGEPPAPLRLRPAGPDWER